LRISLDGDPVGHVDTHPICRSSKIAMGLASFASDLTMPISWDSCVEIGGPYTATVAAAMNMMGNLAGFVAPVVGGVILEKSGGNWNVLIDTWPWQPLCRRPAGWCSIRNRRGSDANRPLPFPRQLSARVVLSPEAQGARLRMGWEMQHEFESGWSDGCHYGGSRGLGEAMAKALSAEGAKIALVARDSQRLELVRVAIADRAGPPRYLSPM